MRPSWPSPIPCGRNLLHLRQRGLGLGQPEGHVHGAVQVDGHGQGGAGLLPLAGGGVQGAQPEVAVGHERAHAEFVGQGQGLLVVGFGLRGVGGIGVGLDGAKLVQRVRLASALLLLPGQVERLACVLPGLLAASRQTTDLAEPGDSVGMTLQPTRTDTFADRLLQQCAPLREAPLERIGTTQTRPDCW